MGKPALSVVIASFRPDRSLALCLQSLRSQEVPVELVVVESSNDGTGDSIKSEFPEIVLVSSRKRLLPGGARNQGILAATGPLLAFLDTDCLVAPDWARKVIQALEQWPVVGGALLNLHSDSRTAWVAYFCESSRWMPGNPSGPMKDLPACSLALRREVFERFGPFLPETYSSDTAFCWKLAAENIRPYFCPEIEVYHDYRVSFGQFLKKRFQRGQAFAELRIREGRLTPRLGLVYGLCWPALVLRILMRIALQAAKSSYRYRFLSLFPLVFLATLAWVIGEARSYLKVSRA